MLTEQQCANGNRHTLSIVRGKTGFGFTVTGARPTCVGRVAPGTVRNNASMKKYIICVDSVMRELFHWYINNSHIASVCVKPHGTAGKTRQIQCEL